jgi:ferredoxin-type protein NapF
VRSCRHDALAFSPDPSQPAWSLKVEIKSDCLARNGVVCRSCGERCEERAIRFRLQTRGRALPEVDASACNGCGECVGVCPSGSVQVRPQACTQAA